DHLWLANFGIAWHKFELVVVTEGELPFLALGVYRLLDNQRFVQAWARSSDEGCHRIPVERGSSRGNELIGCFQFWDRFLDARRRRVEGDKVHLYFPRFLEAGPILRRDGHIAPMLVE